MANAPQQGDRCEPADVARDARVLDLIRRALSEDVGSGDVTTLALVPPRAQAHAVIVARGDCVAAGVSVAEQVFHAVDPEIDFETRARDGRSVRCGDSLCAVRGSARSLLTAERTALNFLQRMTGIATLTARFVEAVRPFGVAILDTRKTTPGLRAIEKYAVRCGGGTNHRMGLYDRVLIKDNHRYAWEAETRRPIDEAVQQARLRYPGMLIEVEVESEEELECALRGTPDWVLLDNMPPDQIRRCVRICHGRARLEASGGITLENIRDVAATGVDAISLGCLTHSAPAADLSLEFTDGPGRPPAGARDPE